MDWVHLDHLATISERYTESALGLPRLVLVPIPKQESLGFEVCTSPPLTSAIPLPLTSLTLQDRGGIRITKSPSGVHLNRRDLDLTAIGGGLQFASAVSGDNPNCKILTALSAMLFN